MQHLPHLKTWFSENKRDFPWRDDPSPYSVWVSEVMLQQTRAEVVIPYFLHWMKKYPTIKMLAEASLDDVIKSWEGLGYYSRARNLHTGARYVIEQYNGQLPCCEQELKNIKGLGPYTVGAILSFAFHQKAVAVDGNVLRVLARYFAIYDDISKDKTRKKFQEITKQLLPEKEPWIIMEALIELGALVCTPQPKCNKCPLYKHCQANKKQISDQLPYKSSKIKIQNLYRQVAIICYEDQLLIKRTPKGKVMSDLHEFPYFDTTPKGMSKKTIIKRIFNEFDLDVQAEKNIPNITHTFTRYRAHLKPTLFICQQQKEVETFKWVAKNTINKIAFSSGHKQILEFI